jgi:hypothetical protein
VREAVGHHPFGTVAETDNQGGGDILYGGHGGYRKAYAVREAWSSSSQAWSTCSSGV